MARNTINYTVTDDGRDKGKTYVLTEMSAAQAESWATRALLALLANNVQLPQGFERMGLAGVAELGLKMLAGLRWEVAEPLLAEMFECVKIMPDPKAPHIVRPLMEDAGDIEEVMTRVKLRAEVWKLHTDFLKAVAPSMFTGVQQAAAGKKGGPSIKTFR